MRTRRLFRAFPNFNFGKMASARRHAHATPSTWSSEAVSRRRPCRAGKKSEMNRHWAKKAYRKPDLHDVSSLQEGGVSIPQPNGVQHAEIMRRAASIEPGPLLHEVDSLGGFDPVSNVGRPT